MIRRGGDTNLSLGRDPVSYLEPRESIIHENEATRQQALLHSSLMQTHDVTSPPVAATTLLMSRTGTETPTFRAICDDKVGNAVLCGHGSRKVTRHLPHCLNESILIQASCKGASSFDVACRPGIGPTEADRDVPQDVPHRSRHRFIWQRGSGRPSGCSNPWVVMCASRGFEDNGRSFLEKNRIEIQSALWQTISPGWHTGLGGECQR